MDTLHPLICCFIRYLLSEVKVAHIVLSKLGNSPCLACARIATDNESHRNKFREKILTDIFLKVFDVPPTVLVNGFKGGFALFAHNFVICCPLFPGIRILMETDKIQSYEIGILTYYTLFTKIGIFYKIHKYFPYKSGSMLIH